MSQGTRYAPSHHFKPPSSRMLQSSSSQRRSPSPSNYQNPLKDEAISPAGVTWIEFPSPVDSLGTGHARAAYLDERSEDSDMSGSNDSTDYRSLDMLWQTIRQKNGAKMAKEAPKVESLAAIAVVDDTPRQPPPRLRKQQSITQFRHLRDGTSVATFDLEGLSKDDVHVSYQKNRLVVTWQEVHLAVEQDGMVIHERRERTSRTIPLPEGTRFKQIRANMGERHLTLKYPSILRSTTNST